MKYKVRVIKEGAKDELIPCDTLKEAEKTVRDLETAFSNAFKQGTMRAIIEED